jgi:hypothetical protein
MTNLLVRCHRRLPYIVHRNEKQIDYVVLLQVSVVAVYVWFYHHGHHCNNIIIICGTVPRYS